MNYFDAVAMKLKQNSPCRRIESEKKEEIKTY